ncbi:MAG: TIGR02757 family protein [Sphingobacteriales bacterium]|nr:MAG: TIGR02757 family protein [Sphingobacteriales bacterium]
MDIKQFLEDRTAQYNRPEFISIDPISIPHLFTKKQDIEIAGFFAATLAWGLRKTIISKCKELMTYMGWAPHEFILIATEREMIPLLSFKHRTFNNTDLVYFIDFFRWFYKENDSLEDAFARFIKPKDETVENGLIGFHELFFSLPESPSRTQKHIATPARNSACKRINMFLRWMVRNDENGVDFGLWKKIKPAQLVMPVDLHVERVARKLELMPPGKLNNWQTAVNLTNKLKEFDSKDPVKYDFALFGMGVMENFGKEEK